MARAHNDWSPWMRALSSVLEPSPSPDEQPQPVPDRSQDVANATPTPQAPVHRIEDDRTAGTRGTTPQGPSDDSGFYAGAFYHRPTDPRFPLEHQVATDQRELTRMNAPTRMTLGQRIGSVIGRAATAGRGERALEQADTLRDRAEARKQEERMSLANRIDANQRTLATLGVTEEGQNLRERIAAQAQVAAAQRLGETLGSRERVAGEQIAGRAAEGQANRESRETIAGAAQQEKYREFQSTDQYRRWKAQLDNATKLHIAQLQQGKAPAALMQTAVFADGGIRSLNDARREMEFLKQQGVMGQSWAQNKVEDWIFGKGAVDPSLPPEIRSSIGRLRTAMNLGASAMTRAHTQRGSKEVYDDLKTRLGVGQDWSALDGAIDESVDMLGQYVRAASDANMMRIRSGGAAPSTPTGGGQRISLDEFLKEPH